MGFTRYIEKPWLIPGALQSRGMGRLIPDTIYLKCAYYDKFGKKLNLRKPVSFNEKLQWLKLYDRKLIYTTLVDKFAVKKYVADIIGEEYIIPTLGVWDQFDDIDFSCLPDKFVLKCTHDSGGLVICTDKRQLNMEEAKNKINASLKRDYYLNGREWPYKNVPRRIIAEKYMADNMSDYKLFCFHGIPRITLVCSDRFTEDGLGLREDFFNENWEHLNLRRPTHGNADFPIPCPKSYGLMKELAIKLSEEIPFARVDFYEVNGRAYFGEITLFPASGFEGFRPEAWDVEIGSWITLPRK